MNTIFYLITTAVLFTACASNKNQSYQQAEETAFLSTLKNLGKKSRYAEAAKILPDLYASTQKDYLDSIAAYSNSREPERWGQILSYYRSLQDMFEAINASATAIKLVQPVNYQNNINLSKQQAAEEYYRLGLEHFAGGKGIKAAHAYRFFKTSLTYMPGNKDAANKMDSAFKSSMVLVSITGIADDYAQELVSDLEAMPNNANQIFFYTDKEALSSNVKPDWAINIQVKKLRMSEPSRSTASQQKNLQIIDSYDTSRNPVYANVSTNISTYSDAVTGDVVLYIKIADNATWKTIAEKKIDYGFKWQNDYANYTGDARALTTQESMLAGRNYRPIPGEADMLHEASSKLKPAIKRFIINAVNTYFGR